MASRKLCAQILGRVPRRQRSTAAPSVAAPSGCPFHFGRNRDVVDEQQSSSSSQIKPYDAIPNKKGWFILGTLFEILKCGGAAKLHEYCDMRHKQLGPIFREKLGAVEAVVLADKDYTSTVYSSEGRYPVHLVPEPWVMYNKKKGIKRGLFFM